MPEAQSGADATFRRSTRKVSQVDVYVASRIRQRRMAAGMSQEKLGASLGVTLQQIQKYEQGINRIGAGRLFQISRALGVPIEYFFEGIESQQGNPSGADDSNEVADPVRTPHGDALIRAYLKIKDKALRNVITSLVKAVADDGHA